MSYASPIKNLPKIFLSSTGLALLASLGIHGLLWAVVPVLPLNSKSVEAESQGTVGLIALTPAEQSRLPQSTPSVNLPPFAMQPSVLPPLPQPPSFDLLPPPNGTPLYNYPPLAMQPSVLPPLAMQPGVLPPLAFPALPPPPSFDLLPPSGTSSYNYPLRVPLPQSQVPLSIPFQNNRSLPSLFPFGRLPAPEPRQSVPLQQTLPPPPPLFTIPRNTGLPNLALKPAEPLSLPNIPLGSLPQKNTTLQVPRSSLENRSATPAQPQAASARDRQELTAALQQRLRQQSAAQPQAASARDRQELVAALQQRLRQQSAAQPQAASARDRQELTAALQQRLRQQSAAQPQAASARDRQELMAALQQRLRQQSAAQPQAASERDRQELMAALQQRLRQQSARNSAGSMSPATAEKLEQINRWSERQNRVQANYSNVETRAPIRRTIKTRKPELDGNFASIGVVVNPEGKIVSGPDLLASKGDARIVQEAKNYVRQYPFPKTDKPTNQTFRIQYKAEADRKPTPETTNTNKPKPTPETTNTNKPKPTPETTNTNKPTPTPETTNTNKPTPAPATTNTNKPTPTPETTNTNKPKPTPETTNTEQPKS